MGVTVVKSLILLGGLTPRLLKNQHSLNSGNSGGRIHPPCFRLSTPGILGCHRLPTHPGLPKSPSGADMTHTSHRTDESEEPDRLIRIGGTILGSRRHICAFFKSHDDQYGVLLPFIKDGAHSD